MEKAFSGRGQFWLIEEGENKTTTRRIATGELTISAVGEIVLALDDNSVPLETPTATVQEILDRRYIIVGRITATAQTIVMGNAYARKPGIFSEGWAAQENGAPVCIVTENTSDEPVVRAEVSGIRMPLGEFWPWMGRPLGEANNTEDAYTVKFPPIMKHIYQLQKKTLTVRADYATKYNNSQRTMTVRPHGSLSLTFEEAADLLTAAQILMEVENLLVLLTDQECVLPWPTVTLAGTDLTGTLYCEHLRTEHRSCSYHDCWLPFPELADFGKILDAWLSLRQQYGPAFHLYVGTRRSKVHYEEHKFINLMWGLEALHRADHAVIRKPWLTQAVIDRVIKIIKPEFNSAQRATIKKIISKDEEPALRLRLAALFKKLPIAFNDGQLEKFCEACETGRNDLSHYGGPRDGKNYDQFITRLSKLCHVIDIFYHILILQRIGIEDQKLAALFTSGFAQSHLQAYLRWGGLHLSKPAKPTSKAQPG